MLTVEVIEIQTFCIQTVNQTVCIGHGARHSLKETPDPQKEADKCTVTASQKGGELSKTVLGAL